MDSRIEGLKFNIAVAATNMAKATGTRPTRMVLGPDAAAACYQAGLRPRSRPVWWEGLPARYILMGKLSGAYLYAQVDR